MSQLNAVLVRLKISKFSNQRQDVSITKEVKALHKLTGNAGRWVKFKLPDEALEPIRNAEGAARQAHYSITLPWDDGLGLVKASARGRYEQEMAKAKQAFTDAVNAFVESYPMWIEQSRVMHNGTFNECDYPTHDKVRNEFDFQTIFFPVPQASHFTSELRESYGAVLEAETAKKIQEAVKEAWDRIIQPVSNMAERLSDPKAIFRDSLVDNVREMLQLLPSLNLTDDAQLQAAGKRIKDQLAMLNPDTLRANPVLRASAAANAASIVKTFGNLGNRKFVS